MARALCPSCMEYTDPPANSTWDQCENCGGRDYTLSAEHFSVCNGCGAARHVIGDGVASDRIRQLYKRIFYFNELISQVSLFEPAIPDPLLALLKAAYHKRGWTSLDQARVHQLCASVSVVRDRKISRLYWVPLEEFLSKQYAAKTGTPLRDFKKFGEKWRRITWELTGRRPPVISPETADTLRRFLATVSRLFEKVRHTSDCTGARHCHRFSGCRHNIINGNYLLKKAFLHAARGNRRDPQYQAIRPWLPVPGRANRHAIRDRFWRPIVKLAGWLHWKTK